MSNIQKYAQFFESLRSDFSDNSFHQIFAKDAYFKDPFQEVTGVEPIIQIFRHMYQTLEKPAFEIHETIENDNSGYIRWSFRYAQTSFEGVSHVLFTDDGLVLSHIDYWDAGANVYELIPFLGWLIRRVKNLLKVRA